MPAIDTVPLCSAASGWCVYIQSIDKFNLLQAFRRPASKLLDLWRISFFGSTNLNLETRCIFLIVNFKSLCRSHSRKNPPEIPDENVHASWSKFAYLYIRTISSYWRRETALFEQRWSFNYLKQYVNCRRGKFDQKIHPPLRLTTPYDGAILSNGREN